MADWVLVANSEDDVIRDMVRVMKCKFEKYWKDYSDILAISAVLDWRMKFALRISRIVKGDDLFIKIVSWNLQKVT